MSSKWANQTVNDQEKLRYRESNRFHDRRILWGDLFTENQIA